MPVCDKAVTIKFWERCHEVGSDACFFAAGAIAAASVASAQTGFPAKAVHLFVPYPAGGAVDILARTLGDELSKNWGQPVIV